MDWELGMCVLRMEWYEVGQAIIDEEFAAMEEDMADWEDEPYTEDEMKDLMITWIANRNR